ncbi:MAG TPA: hypothetical protein VJ770_16810, partial [Stellaceae bacterium]|nr:hypothetical protein [Stellaceae bacterium]
WEAVVLVRGLEGAALETGPGAAPPLPALAEIDPAAAARAIAAGATALSLEASAAYRAGHPEGARWTIRPRLDRLPPPLLAAAQIVLFAEDEAAARLAAVDLAELSPARIMAVRGGTGAWRNAGLPIVASPTEPPDAERIDFVFWNHDRHAGNRTAMEAYLSWETELPGAVAADGLAPFPVAAR